MSNTDERLSDLLAQRAQQGSGVHPTFEGVETVITRRAARRRRHRVVGGAMGAVIMIALVAGAVALSRTDDGATVDAAADLPDVPLVGVDGPGLILTDTDSRRLGEGGSVRLSYTSFASADDPAGPVVTVIVDPSRDESLGGDPVDLDGDGESDGEGDGFLTTVGANGGAVGLLWPLPDGRVAGFGGFEVSEEFLVDYVRGLDGTAFDPALLPSPDGLPERRISTLPSTVATQTTTSYEGEGGTLRVMTTNDPAWFDLMRMSMTVDVVGELSETDLGESFLGPGYAMSSDGAGDGSAYALVRTEAGLTLEISTEGIGVDVVNQILADGALVEVSPVETPAATTSVATATTVPTVTSEPQTTTSIVSPSVMPVDVTLEPGDEFDRLEIFFTDAVPAYELATVAEPFGGDCGPAPTDGEAYLTLRLDVPFTEGDDPWPGIDLTPPEEGGVVRSVWSCGWFPQASTGDEGLGPEGTVHLSIALDGPREPEAYRGVGQPVLIIDIPRP